MAVVLNLFGLKYKLGPTCYCARFLSNLTKDGQRQPVNVNQDILMQNLKESNTPLHIMNVVAKHKNIMNVRHILQALKSLTATFKNPSDVPEFPIRKLLKHPEFETLCNKLRAHVGVIDISETIDSLKALCFLRVPCHAAIVQSLLQIVRHNVNELELSEIVFLNYLLKQFDGTTPLMDALKIALPIVFDVQLQTKLDRNNIAQIAECLHYATRERASGKCVETLVAAAMLYPHEYELRTAVSVIWSLCDLQPDVYYEPLLNRSIRQLTPRVHDLGYNEMETTMTKLVNRFSAKYPFYYNEEFFNACCNYVIDKNLGVETALYVTKKFNRISYVNIYYVDYLSRELSKNPSIILTGDPIFAYMATIYLAATDYKPTDWETMRHLIETTTVFDSCRQRKDIIWLKLSAALISLDIYKPDIIKRGFEEAFNSTQNLKHLDAENLVAISSAISVLNRELTDLLPEESVLKRYAVRPPVDYPLEVPLQKGLGAEHYVKTNCKSKFGIHIDHVVAMRPGGFPVPLTLGESDYIDDVNLPKDVQMILIILLRPYHLTLSSGRLKMNMCTIMKVLEAKEHSVLAINYDTWQNLQDFEKIPYLMQSIKEKIESNERLSANLS